jgi:hypothetical protein
LENCKSKTKHYKISELLHKASLILLNKASLILLNDYSCLKPYRMCDGHV